MAAVGLPVEHNRRRGKPRKIYGDSTQLGVNARLDAPSQDDASHHLPLLNEPGWALNVFWLPDHLEEGVRRAHMQVRARQAGPTPGPAGPRWNQMGD